MAEHLPLLAIKNVSKTYKSKSLQVNVLKSISLSIDKAEMVAIMGPSGSGKSTLMNIIGLLDRPSTGTLQINANTVNLSLPDETLAQLRSENIGFVFQSFNLLPKMTALANVLLPTTYFKQMSANPVSRAKKLLDSLGLKDRIHHKPNQLSGGEKQRVAIARALINDPEIILADEPTGNLDSKSGKEVMSILHKLNQSGKTVIIVTHDPVIAGACKRVIHILDGEIEKDTVKE